MTDGRRGRRGDMPQGENVGVHERGGRNADVAAEDRRFRGRRSAGNRGRGSARRGGRSPRTTHFLSRRRTRSAASPSGIHPGGGGDHTSSSAREAGTKKSLMSFVP